MSRINRILDDEKDTMQRLRLITQLLLGFSERNPGLSRIMTGHALMFEQERLQGRINQFFQRIETQLRQVMRERQLREGKGWPMDEAILASHLLSFAEGSICRFVRSGFQQKPTANFEQHWRLLSHQLEGLPLAV